jgi:aspartyl-tRNA(Asn)/glutamyl-tRNA(Gln) amidotransferase subunit A
MADDIAFMPATRLLALYRSRQVSPVEVIEHTLQRIETYESAINAFVLYDPEAGLAMARASEARWQKGEPQGLLDGVPVALKDTLLTRGWPRLLGSRTIDPNQAWTRTRRCRAGCEPTARCSSARRRPPNSAGKG